MKKQITALSLLILALIIILYQRSYYQDKIVDYQNIVDSLQDSVDTLQDDAVKLREHLNEAIEQRDKVYKMFDYDIDYIPAAFEYYDIPLSNDMQEYIYALATEYQIDYRLILSVIEKESNYAESIVSSTNDYGLMQINVINHEWLSRTLNIRDFLNPEQNTLAGTYLLANLYHKYDSYNKALMAYNMGERGAASYWNIGKTTSAYSESVLSIYNEYIKK